jgi:hypothetical protein
MALTPRSVGQALLDVPFPEMVEKLGLSIAQAQATLDLNSIAVAQELAGTTVEPNTVAIAIKETVDAAGNVTASEVLFNDKPMSLLALGINPTFYAFSETVIEVKMAITMVIEKTASLSFGSKFSTKSTTTTAAGVSAGGGGLLKAIGVSANASQRNTTTVAYSATVNASYTGRFNWKEEGSSLLRTTLRPVPPPARAMPTITVQEPAGPGT